MGDVGWWYVGNVVLFVYEILDNCFNNDGRDILLFVILLILILWWFNIMILLILNWYEKFVVVEFVNLVLIFKIKLLLFI